MGFAFASLSIQPQKGSPPKNYVPRILNPWKGSMRTTASSRRSQNPPWAETSPRFIQLFRCRSPRAIAGFLEVHPHVGNPCRHDYGKAQTLLGDAWPRCPISQQPPESPGTRNPPSFCCKAANHSDRAHLGLATKTRFHLKNNCTVPSFRQGSLNLPFGELLWPFIFRYPENCHQLSGEKTKRKKNTQPPKPPGCAPAFLREADLRLFLRLAARLEERCPSNPRSHVLIGTPGKLSDRGLVGVSGCHGIRLSLARKVWLNIGVLFGWVG